MPSSDYKKRQAHKLASQKWRMRNPDKAAAPVNKLKKSTPGPDVLNEKNGQPQNASSRKRTWRENNPDKAKSSTRAWEKRNPEKVGSKKKAWEKRNPEKVGSKKKAWEKRNPEKAQKAKKAWTEKYPEKAQNAKKAWEKENPEKAQNAKKAWDKKNPEKVINAKKAWEKAHPEIVAACKISWRQRCAMKIRAKYQKWYQVNFSDVRARRMERYRKDSKQELKLRQQRYRMNLVLDSQYYRNKSLAMLKMGQAAAEGKFTRSLASKMWQKEKRPITELLYEAKILITKVMNARIKCVMRFKKSIAAVQKQCQNFLDKANEAGEGKSLESVCGNASHSSGREPYFYDAAYKVVEDGSKAIPLRDIGQKNDEKSWECNGQSTCILPDDCLSHLLRLCAKIVGLKNFRRYMAVGIDKCKNIRHTKKAETIGPCDIMEQELTEYDVNVDTKLGHSIACLPDNCGSDMLFLRQMSVHYPSVYQLFRTIYEVQKFDRRLHGIDEALIKSDADALEAIVTIWSRSGTDVAQEAEISIEKSEDTWEMKIKSLPYALEFLKEIHKRPVYGCAYCRVMHYRSDVRKVTFLPDEKTGTVKVHMGISLKKKGSEKECNDLWLQLYGVIEAEKRDKEKIFVCTRCFTHLSKGVAKNAKHGPMSIFNKLEVADTPHQLTDLNDFEQHLIKKANCFQVVFSLGTVQSKLPASCRVKGRKGAVVHYPLPISETLRALPGHESMPSGQNLFVIVYGQPTKNKIVWKALVDVAKVKKAVAKLKQMNPEYKEVSDDWEPLAGMEMTDDEQCDQELIQECQQIAQKPMVTKIDAKDEERIMDSYTVRPLFKSRPNVSDLELYQMERVVAERIDPREKKLDLWCFPHLYPDGKNGEGEERESKLSSTDFIRSRLYNENPIFRHDHQYLFYLLHKYLLRAIANSISQSLKNTYSYNNVSVGEFLSKVAGGEQELEGNLYTAFSRVRGTAEYWSQQRMDLRTMCRELGPPTWFLTFSAAEYMWDDMREVLTEVNKSVEGFDKMSTGEQCAKDTVFASRHFHHRFNALMNKVILNKAGPLGEITDFFWRCEYQARGAPHFHMVVWVKNAPRIGVDPPEKVLEFIQTYATCRLPDKDKEPLLHRMVTSFQMHRCNSYCKRASGKCRFGFPRHPTDVATLHDPLKNVGQRLRGKTESRLYYLPRKPSETRINDYCAPLLLLHGANMDIQFVGENTQAVVNYIVSYVTKKEKSALHNLWESLQKDKSLWSRLFNIGCRSLSMRECGAYEAADLLVGQRLFKKSQQVKYICARKPESRSRRLKPLSELKEMDSDSTDKYEGSWIDTFYPDRPDSLEGMCLYDFVRMHDRDTASNDGPLGFKTPANGRLIVRGKPYLISHPMYCYKEKPEEYCYLLLLLFKPFRKESETLLDAKSGSCIPVFESELLSNPRLADYHASLVLREEADEKNKEAIERERNAPSQPEGDKTPGEREPQPLGEPLEADLAMQEFALAMRNDAGESLEGNLAKLNVDQMRIFEKITNHFQNSSEPLRMFISGAGGTGKSFLVNTLKMWMNKEYGTDHLSVAVAAPTGLAAFNVNGVTLHKLLQLPIQHRGKTEFSELPPESCNSLRKYLQHVQVFVIDEISMVSNVMLAYLHLRLNEIFNPSAEPVLYGNRSVIVMGDLAQLQPVGDPPAFCPLTSAQAKKLIGGWGGPELWRCMEYDELTINMRQLTDPEFASLLERLRFGQLTEKDVSELQKRLIPIPENQTPIEAISRVYLELRQKSQEMVCLLPYQEMVDEFNQYILGLEGKEIIVSNTRGAVYRVKKSRKRKSS